MIKGGVYMKRISILVLVLLVALLSSCASADESYEPLSNFDQYEQLNYDFKTLTFTNTQPQDILYGTGNPLSDYIILNTIIDDTSLTNEKEIAVAKTFELLDTLGTSTDFVYADIVEYSSQEIKDYSDQIEAEVTVTDLVTFNAIKSDIAYKIDTENNTNYRITKVDYIEKRLDTTLTDEDITALALLQNKLNEYYEYNEVLDLSTILFVDLLAELSDIIGYEPLPETVAILETGFDIIQALHTDE